MIEIVSAAVSIVRGYRFAAFEPLPESDHESRPTQPGARPVVPPNALTGLTRKASYPLRKRRKRRPR